MEVSSARDVCIFGIWLARGGRTTNTSKASLGAGISAESMGDRNEGLTMPSRPLDTERLMASIGEKISDYRTKKWEGKSGNKNVVSVICCPGRSMMSEEVYIRNVGIPLAQIRFVERMWSAWGKRG